MKIDRSFVTHLPQDDKDLSVVWTIVQLAHRLGMTVVAEGVETAGQRDALCALSCNHAQGYLFGRPVPVEQFAAQLRGTAAVQTSAHAYPAA